MSTSSLCVAVIDDDHSVCRSFARLLRAAGMQPVTYGSAEAFLADTARSRFDCMVFDVQLGGMSGIELMVALAAASGQGPPIVIITAYDDAETRRRAEAAGCAAYFRKSDPGADVLAAIRRLTTGAGTGRSAP